MKRGVLDNEAIWYRSPAVSAAIEAVLQADHRRTWDPRCDSPSLATLEGKAKNYGGHYVRSRAALLTKAGVRVRTHYGHTTGALAYIVTMPGEPLSAAIAVDKDARAICHA